MRCVHGLSSVLFVMICAPAFVAGSRAQDRSPYLVDGMAIGDRVNPGGKAYSEYRCEPSQYEGLVWCRRTKQVQTPRGRATITTSVAHRTGGDVVYVSQAVEPAYFAPGEVAAEIDRLSTRFGQRPEYRRLSRRLNGVDTALIAAWGNLSLTEISEEDRQALAAGITINQGYLIDLLFNFKRSVAEGQAIYRFGGQEGYVWSARYDQSGKGVLNFRALNQSAINLEIARQEEKSFSVRASLLDDIQSARPWSRDSEDAQNRFAALELDAQRPAIWRDPQKAQDLHDRIASFLQDGVARAADAAQRSRLEDERMRQAADRIREDAARQRVAEAERLRIAEAERVRVATLQDRISTLKTQTTGLDSDKLPAGLREAARSIANDASGLSASMIDEARLYDLSRRIDQFGREAVDYRDRQKIIMEIEVMRTALAEDLVKVPEEGVRVKIEAAIGASGAAAPSLPASQLRDILGQLREAMKSGADFKLLVQFREQTSKRVQAIKTELDQTTGEFEGLADLRVQMDSLRKAIEKAPLSELQTQLAALDKLYGSKSGDIRSHKFFTP
jgi:hypothetical protein